VGQARIFILSRAAPRNTLEERDANFGWLSALLGRHEGEEVWLFGKGPSLDDFTADETVGIRATINEALYTIDNVSYAFCWHADKKDISAPSPTEVIDGTRSYNTSDIDFWSPSRKAIFIKNGTAELAMSYLILMGFKKIHLIGFDGVGGYSENFKWKLKSGVTDEMAENCMLKIKDRMFYMMDAAGVEYKDYSRN
jgi:hypothetical protein